MAFMKRTVEGHWRVLGRSADHQVCVRKNIYLPLPRHGMAVGAWRVHLLCSQRLLGWNLTQTNNCYLQRLALYERWTLWYSRQENLDIQRETPSESQGLINLMDKSGDTGEKTQGGNIQITQFNFPRQVYFWLILFHTLKMCSRWQHCKESVKMSLALPWHPHFIRPRI